MTYGDIFAILLYRVIGRIGMMTLHLGMTNKGSDMGGRTWDHVRVGRRFLDLESNGRSGSKRHKPSYDI